MPFSFCKRNRCGNGAVLRGEMDGKTREQDSRQMTMRDVLQLRSLEGASLLAGSSGLDREVTNAMVMEGPDVQKWGRPGLVLVTSFFALVPLSPAQRDEFFSTIRNLGIAGIIYKPGRTSPDLLSSCRDTCEAIAMPLVRMDPSVTFEDVLMDVMGTVIDSNARLLDSFYDMHLKTMRLAIQQPSIYQVVSQLRENIGCDVTFVNRVEDARVGTSEGASSWSSLHLEELPEQGYQGYRYFEAALGYRGGTVGSGLAVRIPSQSLTSCYLIAHRKPEDVSAFQRMTIENFVNLLMIELLKQEAIDQRLYNRNNMLVHDLIQGRFTSHDEIDQAVSELGIGAHALYQVMLVRLSIDDPMESDRIGDLLLTFRRRVRRLYPNSVFFEGNNRLSFLRNHTSGSVGFDAGEVTRILGEMHADAGLPDFAHLIVLSGHEDRYSIPKANDQVLSIYRLFDSNQLSNRCVRYDDLGFYKFLVDVGDPSKLASYMDSRLSRLHSESPEGFRTLITLCKCECNYKEAANQLYVHPKTVRYRVGRIREEYGIDVHATDDMMQVLLADKLVALLGPDWEPELNER